MTASVESFIDFAPPSIGEADIDEVVAVLRSGWLSTGARVASFERAFAAYVNAPHAVAVNSCTAALHLSLLASSVGPGDEVVTTPFTFCATVNVIVHAGATPIFVDVDPVTLNLAPATVAAAITPRTRALLPVHFAGRPADAAGFRRLADSRALALIEDAAHCIEGTSQGIKIGGSADFTCFSFYATKNLTTGEGGMVTTTSAAAADEMRVASLHGMSRGAWSRYSPSGPTSYDVVTPGFKYNMTDVQAALGLHQLSGIEQRLRRREEICRLYDAGLSGLPVSLPPAVAAGDRHARHLYTILIDETECGRSRDELQRMLRERGVATSIHFKAVHLHSYYAERYGLRRGMFPIAESASDRILSLPASPTLTDDEVERVIATIHECLR
jgi:dTDP-4-amino-4,6-dideoxygalactose transaminase